MLSMKHYALCSTILLYVFIYIKLPDRIYSTRQEENTLFGVQYIPDIFCIKARTRALADKKDISSLQVKAICK
jgi:hypothetical protein